MIHTVDGDSELFLDDVLEPILVATWIGPATRVLTDKFHGWLDAKAIIAKREAKPLILVSDASRAGRPSADVRRAFAEHRFDPEVTVHSLVVITNRMVLGAMTAIGWLMGDRLGVVNCASLAEALEQASTYAHAQGLVPPSAAKLTAYVARTAAHTA